MSTFFACSISRIGCAPAFRTISVPPTICPMIDASVTAKKMRTLRTLGVPYSDEQIDAAAAEVEGKTEIQALIAYLQGLGTNMQGKR